MADTKGKTTNTRLKLSEIKAIHESLLELEEALSIPPFVLAIPADVEPDALISLLEILPIRVVKIRGGYRCVGNIRLYRLAKAILAPDQVVAAQLIQTRLEPGAIQDGYLTELFYLPALMGLSPEDAERLFGVWKRLEAHPSLPKRPLFSSKSVFSRLLRVSQSRLREL